MSIEEKIGPVPAPLRYAEGGLVIRVGKTRVPLDTVVESYMEGMAAEDIVSAYDSLDLADTYDAISFYIRNRQTVEEYLRLRRELGAKVRQEAERRWPQSALRERLLARREAMLKDIDASVPRR